MTPPVPLAFGQDPDILKESDLFVLIVAASVTELDALLFGKRVSKFQLTIMVPKARWLETISVATCLGEG